LDDLHRIAGALSSRADDEGARDLALLGARALAIAQQLACSAFLADFVTRADDDDDGGDDASDVDQTTLQRAVSARRERCATQNTANRALLHVDVDDVDGAREAGVDARLLVDVLCADINVGGVLCVSA
jgi:hypothetical protein